MAQDGQHWERPDRLIGKLPASSLRTLFLAILVAQALGLDGTSTSPEVSITNYHVSVLHARGAAHVAVEKDRKARAERER